jgi:GR25 family glycosyltransferase involved in LPS biosynthesis
MNNKKKWLISIVVILFIVSVFLVYKYRRLIFPVQNYQPFTNVWTNNVNSVGIPYKKVTENMLLNISNELKKFDVEIFPVYGTLLGMIRHKGVIPWDDDMDICVHKDHFKVILDNVSRFNKLGIGVVEVRKNWPGYFLKLYDITEPKIEGYQWSWPFIDVFSYHIDEDKVVISSNVRPYKYSIEKKDFFPIKSNLFGDIILNIPNNPDKILDSMYGDDWETRCISSGYNHRNEQRYSKSFSISCSDINNKINSTLFDNVWVINLESRQDRWDTSKSRLDSLGIDAKRWLATNAKDEQFIDYYNTVPEPKISVCELACYTSHVKLWEHIYESGVESAIIFEDDIIFPDSVTKEDIIQEIKESPGFNILFLGHCYQNLNLFDKPLTKVGSALCTHGYVITRKCIEKILPLAKDYTIPIDKITYKFCLNNLCYLSHNRKNDNVKTFGAGIVHQDNNLGNNITDRRIQFRLPYIGQFSFSKPI